MVCLVINRVFCYEIESLCCKTLLPSGKFYPGSPLKRCHFLKETIPKLPNSFTAIHRPNAAPLRAQLINKILNLKNVSWNLLANNGKVGGEYEGRRGGGGERESVCVCTRVCVHSCHRLKPPGKCEELLACHMGQKKGYNFSGKKEERRGEKGKKVQTPGPQDLWTRSLWTRYSFALCYYSYLQVQIEGHVQRSVFFLAWGNSYHL